MTGLGDAAFGQLSFYVRCERLVIGRIRGNGYDDLNQTRGVWGYQTHPVCRPDMFGIHDQSVRCYVRSVGLQRPVSPRFAQ